jgi:hypothetical protein
VETVIRSLSADNSSTVVVTPEDLIRGDWHNLILSALEMIRDENNNYMDDATGDDDMDDATGDDATDDSTGDDATDNATVDDATDNATGDDATDNATVEVDEVLDKLLDYTIQAYGSSARDVYAAIVSPRLADTRIIGALSGRKYEDLREAFARVQRLEAGDIFSHTILSMNAEGFPAHANGRDFEVQFKSHWIKTLAREHIDFTGVDNAVLIRDMKVASLKVLQAFCTKDLSLKS